MVIWFLAFCPFWAIFNQSFLSQEILWSLIIKFVISFLKSSNFGNLPTRVNNGKYALKAYIFDQFLNKIPKVTIFLENSVKFGAALG